VTKNIALGKPIKHVKAGGFILLEVLVAMSLVVSSWMAIGNHFQELGLRWGQLQEKRVQINGEADQFERSVLMQTTQKRGVINESTRVLGRSRAKSDSSQPLNSNQR
jgi:hypothetical protein